MQPLKTDKKKKIYAPYQDGDDLLCSRCFSKIGDIAKYGHDEKGYWFIAPCKSCGAKMKWYRSDNGAHVVEQEEEEEATFGLTMVDGELTMIWEEEKDH